MAHSLSPDKTAQAGLALVSGMPQATLWSLSGSYLAFCPSIPLFRPAVLGHARNPRLLQVLLHPSLIDRNVRADLHLRGRAVRSDLGGLGLQISPDLHPV